MTACPACGAPVGADDSFCEACGTELAPAMVSAGAADFPAACPVCSSDPALPGSQVSSDGYCESCGRKVPTGRDHVELDLGLIAGVTDRGLRHQRNEDAMALATTETPTGPVLLAVVCDGVSSSPRPDEASLTAAQAAVRVLLDLVRRGQDPAAASLAAVAAASHALRRLASAGAGQAPSATYASAVITADAVTACWLGDSRVYWLAADTPDAQRLTSDDSLAQEMVSLGLVDEAQAMGTPQAHVITRWLGADLNDPEAHVTRFEPQAPGAILVCSDGLWNYLPEAAGLADLAMPAAQTDPLGAASALLKFAIDAGGMDNITVVLAPFPPARPRPAEVAP